MRRTALAPTANVINKHG